MKNNKNAIIEAIGGLKILLHDFEKKATPRVPFKAMRHALATAIKCCEKQIPKKVIYHDNCGNETPYQSRCPKCYEAINDTWYWAGESWCPYCGQKIQWGD